MVLGTITLSGSILFLFVYLLERFLKKWISMREMYTAMKLGLLYFCVPVIWIFVAFLKWTNNKTEVKNGAEIKYFLPVDDFANIVHQNLIEDEFKILYFVFFCWILVSTIILIVSNIFKEYNLNMLLKHCYLISGKAKDEMINEIADEYNIKKELCLYKSSDISTPVLIGVFHPKIIIPNIKLSHEELKIILKHELMHYKKKDIIFRLLMEIVKGINWFNPLILNYTRMFYGYGELACDESVSKTLSDSEKRVYAYLLIRLASCEKNSFHVATFSNNNENFIKRRIYIIMKKNELKKVVFRYALVLCVVFLSCPLVSFASWKGVVNLQNKVIDDIVWENSVEAENLVTRYVEYIDRDDNVDSIDVPNLKINPRGTSNIDMTLKNKKVRFTSITVTGETTVKIMVSSDSTADSFRVALRGEDGKNIYVNSIDGIIAHAFKIKEAGEYQIFFENLKDSQVHITGNIQIND